MLSCRCYGEWGDKDVILPMLRRLVVTDVNVIFLEFLIIRMFTHVYACFYGTANAARGSPTMLCRSRVSALLDTMTQHQCGELVLGTIAPARHRKAWQVSQLPSDEKASSPLIIGHSLVEETVAPPHSTLVAKNFTHTHRWNIFLKYTSSWLI